MFNDWPPFVSFREIGEKDHGKDVAVAGWLEDLRNLGGIAFVILRQREGTLQVTLVKERDEELFQEVAAIPRESVLAVLGQPKKNEKVRNGFEILPREVVLLSEAGKPLPLGVVDKVGADLDTRLDNRFLDLRKTEVRSIFSLWSHLCHGLRDFVRQEGFVETHTPKLISAGAEGGATLFKVGYFDRTAYLAQSPQLYKQILMSTGLDRVYELAPAFRAELSDTVRHTAEFMSFDGEMAFIRSQEEVLRVLEGAVVHSLQVVKEDAKEEMEALGVDLKIPKIPVPRVEYEEARRVLAEEGREVPEGEDLDTEAEKILGKAMAREGHDMFYIVGYPSEIKPFYIMARDDDPDYSHSFDLEIMGDEMASGGQREHRYDVLVERMRHKGLRPEDFEFYIRAFKYGMPPHGGWGFGLERFVTKVAGLSNIRESILFPRDRRRLLP